MSSRVVPLVALGLVLSATMSAADPYGEPRTLRVERDGETLSVLAGENTVVVQNAAGDFRPYLHPIVAPDGRGVLTESSPGHHRHQTGLYWGFTRVNGRDYFHHPGDGYWRRRSLDVLSAKGREVSWRTVYDLLDGDGNALLTETQTWTMASFAEVHVLDLVWTGVARTDVTIGRYDYGGLFLRMPWRAGLAGTAVNAEGRSGREAEGRRSAWVDVGLPIEGRDDEGHIAILDNPENAGFPQPWRVDGQLGIGPVRARLGDWTIPEGETETIRHRIVVSTGPRDAERLNASWRDYTGITIPPAASPASDAGRLAVVVRAVAEADDSAIRAALLRGMLRGLEGRRDVPPPRGWAELSPHLARSADAGVRNLGTRLAQVFGDERATQRALAVLRDASAPVAARRTALGSLLVQRNREASDALASLLDEPALVLDAIRGYAAIENEAAPRLLLERYTALNPEHRRAVVETLATRKTYATALIDAVEKERVPLADVPVHVARSLHALLGARAADVLGDPVPVAADREALIARYRKLVTPEAVLRADAGRGRRVFERTCAACHTLYGTGGKIGPDLTGSNRANLDYVLLNSVDPSYDVPDAYKTVSIVTRDGRLVNGVLAEEDGSRIVLKTVEQPRLVVAKEDIEIRKLSPKSMMPDGQLEKMKPSEIVDLIKYLRTTEQVEPR